MKYKLKGNHDINLIKQVCETRSVDYDKLESFLNPMGEVRSNPFDYKNLEEAVNIIIEAAKNCLKIGFVVDSDTDGYCSSAMLINYTREVMGCEMPRIYLHENKEHGLTPYVMEKIKECPPDLLIIPDASSSDFMQHKELYDMGIEIVVIDHHETEKYSECATVVNNQLEPNGNKTLSGGGMVLKVLEGLDHKLGVNRAEDYYDLASIALVGDCMMMNVPETRYYVQKGLMNIHNPLVEELIRADSSKNYEMISFDIAPTINAFTRVGTKEERQDLFAALIGMEGERELTIRGQGTFKLPLTEYIARLASRIKSRQTSMIKKALENADTRIITDLPFTLCILSSEVEKGLSGLIGNKLVDQYGKPSVVIKNMGNDYYSGSGRTTDTFPDFKSYLLETNHFEFCEGHAGAFGCAIKEDMLRSICEKYKGCTVTDDEYYLVDRAYENTVSAYDILSVSELDRYWSRGFDKPVFYIKITNLNGSEIDIIGQKRNTIRIKHNNITYLKFKCEENEIENIKNQKINEVEMIGHFSINEWNGNIYPQVIIKHLETKGESIETKSMFSFDFSNINNIKW